MAERGGADRGEIRPERLRVFEEKAARARVEQQRATAALGEHAKAMLCAEPGPLRRVFREHRDAERVHADPAFLLSEYLIIIPQLQKLWNSAARKCYTVGSRKSCGTGENVWKNNPNAPCWPQSTRANTDIEASLGELRALCETAGAVVVGEIVQRREAPDSFGYLGGGKLAETRDLCERLNADLVVADTELTGSKLRNMEKAVGVDVIDRTSFWTSSRLQPARPRASCRWSSRSSPTGCPRGRGNPSTGSA